MKFETRNSKLETDVRAGGCFLFALSNFEFHDIFRISIFGFRISARGLAVSCVLAALTCASAAWTQDTGLTPGPVASGAAEGEGDRFLFDAFVPLDAKAVEAIAKAQEWIASTQRPDGSWDTQHGRFNTGEISYAILALMVSGSVPGEGKYSTQISKGVQFLLDRQSEAGLIIGDPSSASSAMYQHALSTLCLAENFGMTRNPRLRDALIKAVNLIVGVQHSGGSWTYQPKMAPGDISITVMQVMALRAAADIGVHVPEETVERAVKFIKSCYNKNDKGFGYTPNGPAGFARSGAGLVSLQSVGLYNDPTIPDVVDYIMRNGFTDKAEKEFYWYGHYYTSVALYHYGGEPWQRYYPKIKEKILKDWEKTGHHNELLNTSWAVLILGVPYRYLPIYQR